MTGAEFPILAKTAEVALSVGSKAPDESPETRRTLAELAEGDPAMKEAAHLYAERVLIKQGVISAPCIPFTWFPHFALGQHVGCNFTKEARPLTFNSTLFETIVTLDPVLFLALTLQGDFLAPLYKPMNHFLAGRTHKTRAQFIGFVIRVAFLAAVLTLFIYPELQSLVALNDRKLSHGTTENVLGDMIALVLLTAGAFLLRIGGAILGHEPAQPPA